MSSETLPGIADSFFLHTGAMSTRVESKAKSTNRICTKSRRPANGQIESDVVAAVRVPRVGASRARSRGSRTAARRLNGASADPPWRKSTCPIHALSLTHQT